MAGFNVSSGAYFASKQVQTPDGKSDQPPTCPECGSARVWKDGFRRDSLIPIQRWLCRDCGYRFTPSSLPELNNKKENLHTSKRRVCVSDNEMINLATVENAETRTAGATTTNQMDVKGQIVSFLWWAEKQGLSYETIRGYGSCLRALSKREADLLNPESVKEALVKEKRWSPNRRRNVINSYTKFLGFLGQVWNKPRCRVDRKLPSFLPLESEIDALIAGSNKTLACFLQLMKETAMRSGEAFRLKWTDIDSERRLIVLNEPEKGSNPRIWKINVKLTEMLNSLPKRSEKVFPNKSLASLKNTFITTRKRLAFKLQNPRLLRISFHTLRHWRATTEYHRTRDIYHVKNLLGHRKIENTEIYVTLEKTIFGETSDDEFHVKVASTSQEITGLLATGFEYVCQNDGLLYFRKRK